jgi:plastocyanin
MLPRWRRLWLLAWALVLPAGSLALAAAAPVITQAGRAFSLSEATIDPGDTLRFLNRDDFDHQIYVAAPDFTFESDEASPGAEVDVTFTARGTFAVQCHIHPKMHLTVVVK